ncbi:MAG: TlpA disulfide reductase family protein [Flavobacteriaceae bacterium]
MSDKQRSLRWGVPVIIVIVAVIGAGVLLQQGNEAGTVAACAASDAKLAGLEPLARGEVAAFTVPGRSQLLPDLSFIDGQGRERHLSEWRGRTVLLNVWATWCAPCRHEMPALDRLQATIGSDRFEVVAVSIDIGDTAKAETFLKEIGIAELEFYADPTTGVFKDLKGVGRAPGMPTSLLIDANGCELGFIAGPAEWDSADAMRLIQAGMTSPE